MPACPWSRRRFLILTTGASASLLLAACAKAPEETAPATTVAGDGPYADIQPGQGAVVEVNGQEVAAYRSTSGELVTNSAVCPHQGCTVEWIESEQIWECPCHQSTFQPDGEFISGPAGKGLDPLS